MNSPICCVQCRSFNLSMVALPWCKPRWTSPCSIWPHITIWIVVNGKYCLKIKHNCRYLAQVQGQLVWLCHIFIWIKWVCDLNYWQNVLLPKLSSFYFNHVLPFIVLQAENRRNYTISYSIHFNLQYEHWIYLWKKKKNTKSSYKVYNSSLM